MKWVFRKKYWLSTYAITAIHHAINEADGIRKRHEQGVGRMERLDDSNDRDGAWRWLEQQGAGDSDSIPDEVDSNGWREWLVDGMCRLTPRESDFLSARFGLGGCDCRVADMARKYGISQARAGQIVQAGIKKLRRHVAA